MTDFLLTLGSLSLVLSAVILLLWLAELCIGRKIAAKTRYILWIIVVLRLCMPVSPNFLPPVIELPVSRPDESLELPAVSPDADAYTDELPVPYQFADDIEAVTIPAPADPAAIRVIDPTEILFAIWLAGAVLHFAVTVIGYAVSMAAFRKHLTPADKRLTEIRDSLTGRMKLRRAPELYVSDAVQSPMLCGYFRPAIVLPDTELDENAAAGILAHELTHHRRRDLWVKLLCIAAVSLHWFNPAAWLAQHCCIRAMELSCDEAVLAGHDAAVRSAYGNVMLEILRQCVHPGSRKYMPMTTHFRPGKRRVKERFEEIMNTQPRKSGRALIALTLVLCLVSGTVVACVEEEAKPANVRYSNLADVNFEFDGYGRLASASYTDVTGEENISDYTGTRIPVFVNGSLVTGGDIAGEYFGVEEFWVDFYPIFRAFYDNTSHTVERSREHAYFQVDEADEIRSIEFVHETGEIYVNDMLMKDMTFHTETPEPNSFPQHVYVSPVTCALLLHVNLSAYDGSKLLGNVQKATLSADSNTGTFDPTYSHGYQWYLADEAQIIFWNYPADAVQLTETEALLKLQSALIEAYENTYGRFEPLTEKPESSPYPGDEIMLRWQIPNLTITSENDRFWIAEFMGEMFIDKYTGEIFRYYRGLAQFFSEFDPDAPGALMFAG